MVSKAGWTKFCALAGLLLPQLCSSGEATVVPFGQVVLVGDHVPGFPEGSTWDTFGQRVVDNAGHMALTASVTSPGGIVSNGLWFGRPDNLQLVARKNDLAPGISGETRFYWISPNQPWITAGGRVSFWAWLRQVDTESKIPSVWLGGEGTTELIARAGVPAPGTEPGVQFNSFSMRSPRVNAEGQVVLVGGLEGPGVYRTNDSGIWAGPPDDLRFVAREGYQAPGFSEEYEFHSFALSHPFIDRLGRIAFRHTAKGPDGGQTGIWMGLPSHLELVVRAGQHAPGMPNDVEFTSIRDMLLNDSGTLTFLGKVAGPGIDAANDKAIWAGDPSNLNMVVQTGQTAPGTTEGVRFADLRFTAIGGDSKLAFEATLSGTGVDTENDSGLWVTRDGTLQLVAREGDPIPGNSQGLAFAYFRAPLVNSLGQVVFSARIQGPGVDESNDDSLWIDMDASEPRLLVREGDVWQLGPEDERVVAYFHIVSPYYDDGSAGGFNNHGNIFVGLSFEDGAFGVATIVVPEPHTILLLATGVVALLAVWRKKGDKPGAMPTLAVDMSRAEG